MTGKTGQESRFQQVFFSIGAPNGPVFRPFPANFFMLAKNSAYGKIKSVKS
ncbi:MAG: hypothetical protein IJ189_10020 [Clostridia bacterium]|nr:hypothetical protein [Clostridia bacterium]